MQKTAEGFVFDETIFKKKLKDELFTIITKNFIKPQEVTNSVELHYDRIKLQRHIRARDKSNYISEA
jgi:hypothetical protein